MELPRLDQLAHRLAELTAHRVPEVALGPGKGGRGHEQCERAQPSDRLEERPSGVQFPSHADQQPRYCSLPEEPLGGCAPDPGTRRALRDLRRIRVRRRPAGRTKGSGRASPPCASLLAGGRTPVAGQGQRVGPLAAEPGLQAMATTCHRVRVLEDAAPLHGDYAAEPEDGLRLELDFHILFPERTPEAPATWSAPGAVRRLARRHARARLLAGVRRWNHRRLDLGQHVAVIHLD